jgi:hypothetical protein
MVIVWTIAGLSLEGDNIKRIRVRNAGSDLARYIVAGIENPAPTLSSQNLQSQVSNLHVIRFLYWFYELLVIRRSQSARVRHS